MLFLCMLAKGAVTKEVVMTYKKNLQIKEYAVRSINSMLASLNSLLTFLGWSDCKVKCLKQQKQVYCAEEKELLKAEYMRLLEAAKKKAAVAVSDADDLRHRYPCFGTAVFHRRERETGRSRCQLQRQSQDDPDSRETEKAAMELCQKRENPFRCDLHQSKRKTVKSKLYLGTDERAVRGGPCESQQGIPPQSAQAIRPHFLRY